MRRIKFLPFILLFFCTGFLQAADAVYVSEIKFEGSDTFSNKILKKNIRLKSKGIFRQTEFNPKTLKLDVISLQRFYLSKGFVDVEITTGVEDVDDRFVDVSFYITEGKRYKIKSLDVFGNHLLSDQTVQGIIKLKSGDYYNPARIIENLDKLEYEYFSKGKLLVSIAESVDIQRDGVDVKIDISEGRTYHVGEINISGLETKPEKYVRRELKFASGDLYDISKIEKSQNRIFSSGLFSSVEIHPSFPADNDEIVNMEIKVREYTSRSYQFDLGIGQEQS
ncbi:MAG: hypothetical protein H8D46_03840, partial [FCB group bacterium]|nr:hypothetical protein [FCB group bacterium]